MDGAEAKKEAATALVEARRAAVEAAGSLRHRGESWTHLARRLCVSPRTLFSWRRGKIEDRPVGRPLATLDQDAHELLGELLQSMGPDVGIPTLRAMMPDVSRGPLERQLRQYRLGHRRRRRARLYQLRWLKPGSVWAIDLAEPPELVNGSNRMIIAVRDLASRYTIAWLALPRGSAKEVSRAMATLFRRIGAPLVLKSDNGSCFVAPLFRLLLARFSVVHLRSPRAWPQYNGACEAGIGVLKALTDTAAAGRGDPDHWTSDDLEEARGRANDLARKIGATLISAREEWTTRRRVRTADRRLLRSLVADRLADLMKSVPRKSGHRARLRRKAIQEALIQMGLLKVSSQWIRVRSTGRGSSPSYR